ncbi:hypothetical protein LB579_34485, partial [Mesorhizobium sp. BR1-1-7]|uniref:hypothetical protein n=1 Tax=Mesorhizobium sp. BR1-1-7 TaxID=2876647 RepID=UPI001CCB8287
PSPPQGGDAALHPLKPPLVSLYSKPDLGQPSRLRRTRNQHPFEFGNLSPELSSVDEPLFPDPFPTPQSTRCSEYPQPSFQRAAGLVVAVMHVVVV